MLPIGQSRPSSEVTFPVCTLCRCRLSYALGCQPRLFLEVSSYFSLSLSFRHERFSSAFFGRSAPSLLPCRTVRYSTERKRESSHTCAKTDGRGWRSDSVPRETSHQAVDPARILARCRIVIVMSANIPVEVFSFLGDPVLPIYLKFASTCR